MATDYAYGTSYTRARLMLGCGIPGADFKQRFDELSLADQQMLGKVAWRMMVANIIRYQVRFHVPFDVDESWALSQFNHEELPSLELFYLFGCLDTLAGLDHMQFPAWLQLEDQAGRLNLDEKMDVARLSSIFAAYQQHHGVGSRLRFVFGTLPAATAAWLFANVAIYRTSADQDNFLDTSHRRKLQDPTKILNHWRKFFYELHRNPFAHQSTARNIYVPEDTMWAYSIKPRREWELRESTMHYRLDDKWWSMEWKSDAGDIDESVVLRVLIEGAALELLRIPVTPSIVEQFVRSQMRLRAITGYCDEVDSNAHNLERWTSPMAPGEVGSRRLQAQEHVHLNTAWTVEVLDLLDTEYFRENDLKQITDRYLASVRAFNAKIDAFNERNAPIGEDVDRRTVAMRFWIEQRDTADYEVIVNMPRSVRISGRPEQLVSNPCHIYFT